MKKLWFAANSLLLKILPFTLTSTPISLTPNTGQPTSINYYQSGNPLLGRCVGFFLLS